MDKLFIHDLKIETLIGAYDWERKVKQTITLDIEYGINAKNGASTDHIDSTCNYIDLGQVAVDFIKNSEFYLVETLAEKTAALLLEKFDIPWIKLYIRKMGTLCQAKEVGIEIVRHREQQTAAI